jgi:hypothetical protein
MWPQEAPLYHTGGQVRDQLADMFDVGQTNGVAGGALVPSITELKISANSINCRAQAHRRARRCCRNRGCSPPTLMAGKISLNDAAQQHTIRMLTEIEKAMPD